MQSKFATLFRKNFKQRADPSDIVTEILQAALLVKRPMVPHARLGGDAGMLLNRVAFAVILKFSGQQATYSALCEEVSALEQATPKGND